jgi:YVTN family beta-propeller protein
LPQRRWLREGIKLAAAAVIFGLIGAILVLALQDDDQARVGAPDTGPTPIPSPSAPSISPTQAEPSPTVAAVVPTATTTTAPASTPTPDWSTVGEVIATIPVGSNPELQILAAGSFWVSNTGDETVSRIDPVTNTVVATIPVGSRTDHPPVVAAFEDDVWVLNPQDRTLMRIDLATNTIATTISIGTGENAVTDPQRLAVSDGAIWVTDTHNHQVARIDPQTQAVVALIPDINLAHSIGATGDAVWVTAYGTKEIVRIDPATNQVVARIASDELALDAVYVIGDEVWASDPGHVVRIDPATNEVDTSITLPQEAYFEYGGSIGVGDGSIWIAARPVTTLYRIDIATQAVTSTIQSRVLIGVVHADGTLWLTGLVMDAIVRIVPAP